MNIKEFRIGNLLQENNTKEIIEVLKLSKDELFLSGNFKREWQAEPIPLTEEWLLKFGLIYNDENYWELVGAHISLEWDGMKDWDILCMDEWLMSLKYVHQLQNLYFALTGSELSIQPKA